MALLAGCYRRDEVGNPEIYAMAVESVLSEFSNAVVEYVTDPRTGLPSRLVWLPSVAEVRKACDEAHEWITAPAERQRRIAAQLAERKRLDIEDGKRRRKGKTYDQLAKECAADGIFIGPYARFRDALTPKQVQDKLGISQEQWDAIPNAKPRA